MPVRIQRWIESQGFTSHPFEYWEADRETTLSGYFVQAEWFDALRGDTRQPRSAVLFAPRGHGKSSHRIQIARLCGSAASDPALIVPITEYDWLPPPGTERITEQHYVRYIAFRAALALWDRLQQHPATRARFDAAPRKLLQLHAFLHVAALRDPWRLPELALNDADRADLARWLRMPHQPPPEPRLLVETMAHSYARATQSDILDDLVDLARFAGFASIYILVDRVDEDRLTEHDVDAALERIHPLVSNLHLLEHPGVACKFFLPDHLHDAMIARRISRIDERLPAYTLSWSDDDLAELLRRRLAFYSHPVGAISGVPAVTRFQDLCEPGSDADRRLIAAARGSPRRLIITAARLIASHCARIDDTNRPIGAETLDALLGQTIPALHLDPAGHLWIGGVRQPTRLPRLPRLVLEYLWQHRRRYVTRDELAAAFYTRDQQPESIQRVITRLRALIEPDTKNSKHYIDFVEGLGYRLVNIEDEIA